MVNRCICMDVYFTEIAERAAKGEGFEQIRAATGCCDGCGTCEPYVRVVIATGKTVLPVLSEKQCDEMIAKAGEWKKSH